ncbi:VWA domain-containing protein [Bradyrhizobium sp. AUGA SZCCT0160]|uniref:VWA domain-containing protein n=1 Tax=Bradyrhizobium sp. AUGA SZCCT0160 TaxID=2807662 RepID=UPI001BA4936D|nr:VWA domain-containing protein [Bradyrhizobium sp. AUGA SZCCT0160]MBR1194113.1 VWA domain-containing protein [Bradyrhizobium sp. AUGA SZCCT0160]
MWLILLDASGSMADPFSSTSEFAARTRQSKSTVKIDAAKESLILHMRGLGQATETAIFVFRDEAELIYEGLSSQNSKIEATLATVKAGGGTDIAAALTAVSRHVDAHPDQPLIRVLLISDGLSSVDAAESAAAELRKRRVPIDAILIDPSEPGEELIRRVIGGLGSVSGVTSVSELGKAIGDIGEEMRSDVAAAAQAQTNLDTAMQATPSVAPAEDVSFTAAYPGELAQDNWASLLVYVHLSALGDEARSRALGLGRLKGAEVLSPSMPGSSRFPRGTTLTLTPRIEDFVINPPAATINWYEDIESHEFRIRPGRATSGPILGEVEVAVRGLPIARVPLSILVRPTSDPRPGNSESKTSVCGPFKTVFASYARTNLDVVKACASVYSGLGIYTVIDKDALIAGQAWRPAIRALMARADAFQLFWSNDSSVSRPVQDEIVEAISLQGDRGEGFIRPTYWIEPPPPLPPQLASLNFTFLDLDWLKNPSTDLPSRSDRDVPLTGAAKIPVAVLPLLPGTSINVCHEITADTSFAVDFIEQTTAARYYPVPTLLVDEYTVRSIRATQTVDYEPLDHQRQKALLDWSSIIGSITVAFHVNTFWDGSDAGVAIAQHAGLNSTSFEALRRISEGHPRSWLQPAWVSPGNRNKLNEILSLHDAAASVVEAALAADTARSSTNLKSYLWSSEIWMDWQAELEPMGLKFSFQYLDASGVAFRNALLKLWRFIEPVLVGCTDRLEPPALPSRFQSAVHIADAIIHALKGQFATTIDFILRELDAGVGWRSAHAELLNLDLPGVEPEQKFFAFADVFFGAITTVLKQRIREAGDETVQVGYTIPMPAWRRIEALGLRNNLTASETESYDMEGGKDAKLNGPISGFIELLNVAWARARAILSGRIRVDRFIASDVPTYGIFAPAKVAKVDADLQARMLEWGLRSELMLPNTDRVLLCGNALDDFRATLTKHQKQNVARLFLRSILVHEHFHAFLETAPMSNGKPPPGPNFLEQWNAAKPVNEALAAWMQVHMARDNQPLSSMIGQYVSAGSYPEWPYAGAETIETVYQKDGIEEIRNLIGKLRTDPPLAIAWMEKHAKQRLN